MQTQQISHDRFEFQFPKLDTLILLENREHEIVIHATRDAFSEQRKLCFIHELAEEGFIPDSYRWFSSFASTSRLKVWWLIDASWLDPNRSHAITDRFMRRLLIGVGVVWLGMLATLFLR